MQLLDLKCLLSLILALTLVKDSFAQELRLVRRGFDWGKPFGATARGIRCAGKLCFKHVPEEIASGVTRGAEKLAHSTQANIKNLQESASKTTALEEKMKARKIARDERRAARRQARWQGGASSSSSASLESPMTHQARGTQTQLHQRSPSRHSSSSNSPKSPRSHQQESPSPSRHLQRSAREMPAQVQLGASSSMPSLRSSKVDSERKHHQARKILGQREVAHEKRAAPEIFPDEQASSQRVSRGFKEISLPLHQSEKPGMLRTLPIRSDSDKFDGVLVYQRIS